MKEILFKASALLAMLLAVVACQPDNAKTPEPVRAEKMADDAKTQRSTEAEKADRIYEDYFEVQLELNPISATFLGDPRYNDRLANSLSPEHRAKALAIEKDYLSRINRIDAGKLSGQDLLSYKIFKQARERDIEGDQYPGHLIPLNQFYNVANFMAMLGSGTSAQPFNTVQDYDNWLSRIDDFSTIADQIITNMREGMDKGIVQPRVLMERVLPQLQAHMVSDVEQSIFYKPVANMPEDFPDADKARLTEAYKTAIRDTVVPSYTRLHDFLANEYMTAARDTVGLGALPDGDDWYRFLVKSTTSTDLTPEQIHNIGLREVSRIQGDMRRVMLQVQYEGSLKDFFEYTKTDPQFVYGSKEELLDAYENLRATVDELTPKLFKVFPKATFEIRAVEPFREKSASGASYQRAPADGSRPGIFYVNTYDLTARPSWAVESLFLHEAAPGHHFQISIQQELQGLPKFRLYGGNTAYVEGWGLYAESLGKELGVYTDPYQYFGALTAELWRAIRLVVDTGIHAKGWTRQQVLDYMYANAPVAEARAVSEAERFMAIPSQALAYKIGQLKIRELRDYAEHRLGSAFDVREFHWQILKDGALPLDILEDKIEAWVESQRG